MSKCFISCRHVDPDQQLAQFLQKYLEEHGHEVFIDTGTQVGVKWVEEIERHIKSAEFFILLLSKNSIRSDMVRQEIKLAYQLSAKRHGRYKILPVRVDFAGALPYDLASYLDPFKCTTWTESEDFAKTAEQVAAVIADKDTLPPAEKPEEQEASGPEIKNLYDATEAEGAPLPAADQRLMSPVELETGTIKLNSPFYVKRDTDDDVMEQVRKQGSTTIIKAPRQMGKSSLLVRTHALVANDGLPSCFIDFQFLDKTHLSGLNNLFKYLAHKMARAFKTKAKPEAFWNEYLGPDDSITQFLREAVLKETDSPVLILFDEVDRLFNQTYCDDVFATVREWHNLRAREKCWANLNIVIAHSTEPYLWIQDINQSPFNVGLQIKLDDFDLGQVVQMNELHGSPLAGKDEIKELLDLTGGQPYLVRLALYEMVKNNYSISQLVEASLDERGPFGDHLRRFLWALQTDKGLKESLQQALSKGECEFETHFMRLRSAGLVKGDIRNEVHLRCKLYEDFFKKHL